jgi:hemerythrin-like domain-containing protein
MCDHCGCRSYPPIAELTAEHVEILALAGPLAEAVRAHHPVDGERRERLVALLASHAAKEEAGLYPLLIAEMGEQPDAFDHLEDEHRELLQAVSAGVFAHHALYALQRHIEEEEEVLFSGALFHFDGDTWDDLAAAHRHVHHDHDHDHDHGPAAPGEVLAAR